MLYCCYLCCVDSGSTNPRLEFSPNGLMSIAIDLNHLFLLSFYLVFDLELHSLDVSNAHECKVG